MNGYIINFIVSESCYWTDVYGFYSNVFMKLSSSSTYAHFNIVSCRTTEVC